MSLLSMTLNLLMGGSKYLLSLFMIISVNPRGNLFDKFFCLGFYHISVRNQNHTPFTVIVKLLDPPSIGNGGSRNVLYCEYVFMKYLEQRVRL